jgi:glycosyltransferase involved in cell wall biosynthesis
MRIAHVIDYFHTDVGYHEYYLAKCMAEAGHHVQVIASRYRQPMVPVPGPDEASGRDALEAAGVEVVRLPAIQLGHGRVWLHGLERALHDFRPDAVHCHGPFAPTTVRVARAKRRLGYTLLVDNHAHELIAPAAATGFGRAMYRAYRHSPGRTLRSSVNAWAANGPYEAGFLAQRLGLAPSDVDLIPLGFDPLIFRYDRARRDQLRTARGWLGDLVVAVTGKVYARKRPDLVAQACSSVAHVQPVRLVFAGAIDDDARAAVEREGAALASAGRLEYLPMLGRTDLADLYMAADVVVFARLPSISIYEASGSGVRLLVGQDSFSQWLHRQCPAIEAVDPFHLEAHLSPATGRTARAAAASDAFSWSEISERFLHHYRRQDVAQN